MLTQERVKLFAGIRLGADSELARPGHVTYGELDIKSDDSQMVAKRQKDWRAQVKRLLRAELSSQGLTYADLADKLAGVGVKTDRRNISNKIGRGSFSAVFFIQCLHAIGCQTVRLNNN